MFKIYPDKYVEKQLILNNINLEIIFTLLEDNLEIIYGDMHVKIQKNSINKVVIKDYKDNNYKKIFLNLKNNIIMEYICFSNEIDIIKLKDFFKDFKLNEGKIK